MIFRGMTYKTNRAHKSFLFFRPEQYYQLSCLKKVEWSGVKLSMYAITIKFFLLCSVLVAGLAEYMIFGF